MTDKPAIILNPHNLAENGTGEFQCKANFAGPWDYFARNYFPHLKMFYANDPDQELSDHDLIDPVRNTFIKVSNSDYNSIYI